MGRPSGAGPAGVHVVSDDPPATAKELGEQWGAITEDLFDGCTMIQTGAVEILIWSPSAYQTEYKSVEAMAPEHGHDRRRRRRGGATRGYELLRQQCPSR